MSTFLAQFNSYTLFIGEVKKDLFECCRWNRLAFRGATMDGLKRVEPHPFLENSQNSYLENLTQICKRLNVF